MTLPSGRKAGSSCESFSSVELARGPSSLATSVPSGRVTGTISRSKKPSSCDLTASSWERWAYLSMSARLTSYLSATFSAVSPIEMYAFGSPFLPWRCSFWSASPAASVRSL